MIDLTLGGHTFQHKCYLSGDPIMHHVFGILGSGFKEANNLVVWLAGHVMWFENNPQELIKFENNQQINCISCPHSTLTTTLKSIGTVTIPGQSETIIWAKGSGNHMPDLGVVEKYQIGNNHLAIAGSLVCPVQGKVPVRIYNN